MIVVDASVVIKCLLPEDGSREAITLVETQTCIAPDLLIHECVNALWKNVRTGRARPQRAVEAIALLEHLDITLVESRPLASRALELAMMLNHPAYDCFYLALAERRGAELIVVDGTFARKVHAGDVTRARIRSLRDSDA